MTLLPLMPLVPWILPLLALPFVAWWRPRIDRHAPRTGGPPVSVIVPARDEAEHIGACVATLMDALYRDFEILVVDDRSEDGTGEIARALAARGGNGIVRVVTGAPPPDGWVGKSWACWQGYRRARGELLLFTDADTRHDAPLLGHAVGALEAERAALVSVLPGQPTPRFWDRVVLPPLWFVTALGHPPPTRVNRARRPRAVRVASQYVLVRREAYDAVGGHRAVAGEVVAERSLARRIAAAGGKVYLAHGEALLTTRVYPSLPAIVRGWSKKLAVGARTAADRWVRPYAAWLLAALLVGLWVVPLVALVAGVFGFAGPAVRDWAAAAVSLSLLLWIGVSARLRIPVGHAFLFPIGAAIAAWVFALAGWRGGRVRWKGRVYARLGGGE